MGICLAVTWLVWGTTYLAIEFGLHGVAPLTLSAVRFLLAGLLLWLLAGRDAARLTARQWGRATVSGVLLFTVGMGGVTLAEDYVDSATAALLIGTVPVWSVVLNVVLGRPAHALEWAGVTVGLAGVAVLSRGMSGDSTTGLAILLPAALAWVAGSLLDDHSTERRVPAAQMLVGGAVLAVLAAARGEFAVTPRPSWDAVVALSYLVVLGSLAAMAAYRVLLAHTSAAVATSYAFVSPVIAVTAGALVLGEPLTAHTLPGMVLIVSAVVLTGAGARRSTAAAAIEPPGAGPGPGDRADADRPGRQTAP